MPPQSRGSKKLGSHSQSTPNLSTIHPLEPFPSTNGGHDLDEPSRSPVANPSDPGSANEDDTRSQSSIEREIFSPSSSHESDDSNEDDSTPSASTFLRPSLPTRRLPLPAKSNSQSQAERSFYIHPSRSQSYLGPPSFAPPFYNRPPTPFPPSPSLSSLLRPSFSAQPSRPTTPDSSDTEATGGASTTTADAVAQSARTATTVPRASPKVPTYEYYGFVLHLGSSLVFLMYLLWSYLPTPFLHQLGIYYYPNRWWSLAVPAWLVVAVLYVYVALAAWNTGYLTKGMGSVENFVDAAADVAVVDSKGRIRGRGKGRKGGGVGRELEGVRAGKQHAGRLEDKVTELNWRSIWSEGTDAVMDVPIGGVCEILYGAGSVVDEPAIECEIANAG